MTKDSIQGDIENEFLSPEQYCAKLENYIKIEMKHYRDGKAAALDKDNLALISDRMKTAKAELDEMKAGMAG